MTQRPTIDRFPAAALAALAALVALIGGCAGNGPPYVTPDRLDHGLVIILPGIEGPSMNNASIRQGLFDAPLPYAIEIDDWAGFRPGTTYAFDLPACRKTAGVIADRIAGYHRDRPGKPVVLVGHSGGGAIAVFAAEAVAEAVVHHDAQPLAGLITLAPALSPQYDLTAALIGCGGRMANCFTQTDVLLRAATTVGRNFDGVAGPSAGQAGFSIPDGAPPQRRSAFDNLRQIEWARSMIAQGNLGGHLGWASARWVNETLAPIVRQWCESPITPMK